MTALEMNHLCESTVLTIEDVRAHERLIAALPRMKLGEVVQAYRKARRLFEARYWSGQDPDEPRMRSDLLALALQDRELFGSTPQAPP